MLLIDNEQVIGCDVDDTLVMWDDSYDNSKVMSSNRIAVVDPYTGKTVFLTPHRRHIDLVRKFFIRGKTVVFWSQQGAKWAETIVKALGLEHDNAVIMTKPSAYIDDLPCTEWMGNRIYIKE